jgi:hypothetical protein
MRAVTFPAASPSITAHLNLLLFLAAGSDHSDCDCFVMAVLSHGKVGEIYSLDQAYESKSLWDPFTADKCPTLAGKPKLFFIEVKYFLRLY